jgi:hypothetical protein
MRPLRTKLSFTAHQATSVKAPATFRRAFSTAQLTKSQQHPSCCSKPTSCPSRTSHKLCFQARTLTEATHPCTASKSCVTSKRSASAPTRMIRKKTRTSICQAVSKLISTTTARYRRSPPRLGSRARFAER